MHKKDYIILGLILMIAFVLRLYKIDIPLADAHSWRQADTAAVSRNFARTGINLLKPAYDDLSSIQTGQENPEGLRMVEFPLYNAIVAVLFRYLPIVSIEIYGRLVTAFFSLIIIAVLYYFGLHEQNRLAAASIAGVYAVFPFFVFFSRVVLPETTALSCMMLSLLLLYQGLHKKKANILLLLSGAVLFAVSVLIKPTTIFYAFAAGYLFIQAYTFDVFTSWKPYVFFLIGLLPLIWWRWYILQFPEGIPGSSWLITQVNTSEGLKEIFFRPAFFRWIFMERIGIDILGVFGIFFFLLGLVAKQKKYFMMSMVFSGFIYLLTFQGGNVQHTYYQTIFLPVIALLTGSGIAYLFELPKQYINRILLYPLVAGTLVLSIFFSYYRVKDYYIYPQDLPRIAELIKTFTRPDEKIVTDRLGDTTLLYLADRKGAPAIYKEIDELKGAGYSYLVTSNGELITNLKDTGYTVLVENGLFALVKL